MFLKTRKIVSMLIIFVITFTYMGQTLEAIATTDGLSAITSGFFNQSDVMFGSYFIENGSKTTGKVIDVNEKATVVFEVSPTNIGEGFIKDATISSNTENEGNVGFKFSKINDIKVLEDESTEMSMNWNKRYRDNMEKMKTGDIYEVADIVRNLSFKQKDKGLSTGEKKMLLNAKQILVSELVLAQDKDKKEVEELVEGKINESYENHLTMMEETEPLAVGSENTNIMKKFIPQV